MKKIAFLFCTALMLLSTTGADAYELIDGNGYFEVEKGALSIFKQKVNAYLVIDYSQTEVVEFGLKNKVRNNMGPVEDFMQSNGSEWVEDWGIIKENVQNRSENRINKKTKVSIVPREDAQYEIRLVITHLDFGNTTLSVLFVTDLIEEGGAKFEGRLIVTEIATGNVACDMRIDWVQGLGDFTQNQRLMYTVGDVFFGRFIPKFAGRLKAE